LVNAVTEGMAVSSVVPDENAGVRLAVSELLDHGHRRIGYIGNTERILATPMRLRAYRSTMRRAGITPAPEWIAAESPTAHGGYLGGLTLLRRPHRPTAIFCFSDTVAVGVYHAAQELGLRIPGDVSVVGFDNLELIATNLFPGLTTVSLPHYEMGAWAVGQLLAQIADSTAAKRHAKLAGALHRRDSVAAPTGA
jgi:LacI family transcriptional regulator